MSDAPLLLLLTSWHLPSVRPMPRLFAHIRRLERDCRAAEGCVGVHRWVSRRSLMLASEWESHDSAEAWMASLPFRRFDALARALGGEPRVRRATTTDGLGDSRT